MAGATQPSVRLGVDVLRVAELDRLLTRAWFRRLVYADDELTYSRTVAAGRAREFLAGRFAAKEAMLKVLGTGLFRGIAPREIAVHRTCDGAPAVHLSGNAAATAARLGLVEFALSITHKGELVAAIAIGCSLPMRGLAQVSLQGLTQQSVAELSAAVNE